LPEQEYEQSTQNETDTGLDLTNQDGVAVQGDVDYFVWDRFVLEKTKGNIDVFANELTIDYDRVDAAALLAVDSRLHETTIWLSIPGRPSSLVWDPFVGYDDTYSSSPSSVLAVSVVLLLITVLFAL